MFGLFGAKKPKSFEEFIEGMTIEEGESYIEYMIRMSRTCGSYGSVKLDTYLFVHYCDDFGKNAATYAEFFAKKGSGDAAFYMASFMNMVFTKARIKVWLKNTLLRQRKMAVH